MIDLCPQCRFPFIETTNDYYKRLKDEGHTSLCRDCKRLNNAESNQKIREIKKDDEPKKWIRALIKKHGQIPYFVIMRKLKVTYDEAVEIAESAIN